MTDRPPPLPPALPTPPSPPPAPPFPPPLPLSALMPIPVPKPRPRRRWWIAGVVVLAAGAAAWAAWMVERQGWLADPLAPIKTTPLTEPACRDWAARVAASVTTGDGSLLDRSLSAEAMLSRHADKLPNNSRAYQKGFLKGVKQGLERRSFGQELARTIRENEGTFDLLRLRRASDRWMALFRCTGNNGVNYLDMYLIGGPDGQVMIEDIYLVIAGQTLGEIAVGMAAGADAPGALANIQRLQEAMSAARGGESQRAMDLLDGMPPALRDSKLAVLARVLACQGRGDADYLRAMDNFERLFPNDPAIDLVSLDGLFLRKKFDQALQAIDRLDRKLGGDPYLEIMRANTLAELGRLADARACVERGIVKEPNFVPLRWGMVHVALAQADFKAVSAGLLTIEKDLKSEIPSLQSQPEYSAFLRSSEYAQWVKARRAGTSTRAVRP